MSIHFNSTAAPRPGSSREMLSPGLRGSASAQVVQVAQTAQTAQGAPAAPVSAEALQNVARQINDFIKSDAANIEFSVDSESNQVVVRIIDTETREVIRQIPTEVMLGISQSLSQMTGLLINQKA